MRKKVWCIYCLNEVVVILRPLGCLMGEKGWVFGICPLCGEIAYIKRRE